MEALFLLLVAAVLFTHAWCLMGLFADPRTSGLIAGALALGLVLTAATSGMSSPVLINPDTSLVVNTLRGMILLWAVYAATLSANGLWGLQERALGFHALFMGVFSLAIVGLPFVFTAAEVSLDAGTVISVSSLILAILSFMAFFSLGVPFRQIRSVTGWFFLVGSIIIGVLGITVMFGAFQTVAAA